MTIDPVRVLVWGGGVLLGLSFWLVVLLWLADE